jgi:hypothetical protein
MRRFVAHGGASLHTLFREASMQNVEKPTSWRDGEFIRPDRAAKITGMSTNYIRQLIGCKGLRAVQLAPGGPMMITVESLITYVDAVTPVVPDTRRLKLSSAKPGADADRAALAGPRLLLKLVVDNTAP